MEEKGFSMGAVIGYILLIGFAVYAALKFYNVQSTIALDLSNRKQAAPGVSYYCNRMITHRVQQVQAFQTSNNCSTTQYGYAPAFGPNENMPSICSEVCGVKLGLT